MPFYSPWLDPSFWSSLWSANAITQAHPVAEIAHTITDPQEGVDALQALKDAPLAPADVTALPEPELFGGDYNWQGFGA